MEALLTSQPILETILGIVGIILVIFVHGIGIRIINQRFFESWIRVSEITPRWRINVLLAFTIGSLGTLHFLETLFWAVPGTASGLIPSMRDSYYFVLETYTTLGEGNVTLPNQWRLIGPIIAMSGLFTFGWTGSVLVNIMTEFGKVDRKRSEARSNRRSGE